MIFTDCANQLYPLKRYRMWGDRTEWADEEVQRAVMKKMELYKKAKSSGDDKDWDLFKTYKGRVNSLRVRKKRIYITKTLHSSRNNARGLWKEMGKNLRVGKHKPSTGCTAVKKTFG